MMRRALPLMAVLLMPFAASAEPAMVPITSAKDCETAGRRIAAENPEITMNTQLVTTHFARRTGRCYVLLTVIAHGANRTVQATIRTLYRGETGRVLAIASDQAGTRSGVVSDPTYTSATNPGYDTALAYIGSKMSFD